MKDGMWLVPESEQPLDRGKPRWLAVPKSMTKMMEPTVENIAAFLVKISVS
jgi:hypothetical protein